MNDEIDKHLAAHVYRAGAFDDERRNYFGSVEMRRGTVAEPLAIAQWNGSQPITADAATDMGIDPADPAPQPSGAPSVPRRLDYGPAYALGAMFVSAALMIIGLYLLFR